MKRKIFILILLILITANISANDFYRVEVRVFSANTRETINLLQSNGMDDIIGGKPDIYFDAIIKNTDLPKLDVIGVKYQIIEANLTKKWSEIKLKGRYNFGPYYTYWEMIDLLDAIHTQFPGITTSKYSIGLSTEGNEQWIMKISDNPDINENEPSFFVNGVHHAREPITCNISVDFAKYLCENYETDPSIKWLIDNREIYILPVENPDGYIWDSDSSSDGMWRKNKRDNDNNGYFNESQDGVDPNRNYTYMWGYDNSGSSPTQSSQTYRGPSAGSEPITQNMMNFINANANINIIMNYHSYGNLFLYPWGYEDILTPDSLKFIYLSDNSIIYNGYAAGTAWQLLYNTNGDACDWGYGDAGRFPLTAEVGEAFYQPDSAIIAEQVAENIPMLVFLSKASGAYVYPESLELNSVKNRINPGETYQVTAFLRNAGVRNTASNVSLKIESNDPYIVITSPSSDYNDIAPINVEYNADDLRFFVTDDCPSPYVIKVNIVTYFNGTFINTPSSFSVGDADTLYAWDFESGTSGWNLESPWALTTSSSHSTSHSLTDSPGSSYSNNISVSAIINDVDFTDTGDITLSFWHKYEIENGWDYGYVQIKKGNGNWSTLENFTGTQSSFTNKIIDIQGYDTSDVSIRFKLESDSYVTEDGWYIDDVKIIGIPASANKAPSVPIPVYPIDDTINLSSVTLKCLNATDPEDDPLTYKFFIYSDSFLSDTIFESSYISEGIDTTSVIYNGLNENMDYYWRTYAYDGNTKGLFSKIYSFNTTIFGISNNKNISKSKISIRSIPTGVMIDVNKNANYTITDLSGRSFNKGTITGKKEIIIPKSGIYFVRVSTNNRSIVKKIIIIK